MSTSGGVSRALDRAASIGCEIVQIFLKNNMQWFGRPYSPAELARYGERLAAHRFARVFGHTGYLINLAAPPSANRDKSIASLIQEIELATALGLPFLVMHPGAHLGAGEAQGINRAARGLDEVFRATKTAPVRIALENTAGQGTGLGHRMEHLAEIYTRVARPERLAVCLDTAHLFAAGYDIRTARGWNAAIGQIESLIGLKEILAFHLNDSKTGLGARVDRHAHIGQGRLGRHAFRHIVNDQRFANHSGCIETPKSDDLHEDVENLAALRALVVTRRSRPARLPKSIARKV